MPKNNSLGSVLATSARVLKKYLRLIVLLSMLGVIIWLSNFTYQNVVKTVVLDTEIDETQIVARKQKINVSLFEKITTEINSKKTVDPAPLLDSDDPFN